MVPLSSDLAFPLSRFCQAHFYPWGTDSSLSLLSPLTLLLTAVEVFSIIFMASCWEKLYSHTGQGAGLDMFPWNPRAGALACLCWVPCLVSGQRTQLGVLRSLAWVMRESEDEKYSRVCGREWLLTKEFSLDGLKGSGVTQGLCSDWIVISS